MAIIEPITALPTDFSNLVRQSEKEGYAFVRRLVDKWNTGENQFDCIGECLLAAYDSNSTIGICGINIDPYTTQTGVARLRHLYVAPAYRSQGLGSHLVKRCLGNLHNTVEIVRLRVPDKATGLFYEKLGFSAIEGATATHILKLKRD